MELTQERLKRLLNYDNKTGKFTWRINRGRTRAGDRCKNTFIVIDGLRYHVDKLVWLLVYGAYPEKDIIHFDGEKSNNRVGNLGVANRDFPIKSKGIMGNNRSGITGVYKGKDKKWHAQIKANGKVKNLGAFRYKEDAVKARWDAEIEYEYPMNSTAFFYLKRKRKI